MVSVQTASEQKELALKVSALTGSRQASARASERALQSSGFWASVPMVLMGLAQTVWVMMALRVLAWHLVLGTLVSCPESEEQWGRPVLEQMVLAPMKSSKKVWAETVWAPMGSAPTETVQMARAPMKAAR